MDDRIKEQLSRLAENGLKRSLRTLLTGSEARVRVGDRTYLNLASNNYLGLATDERVIEAARAAALEYGVGAGSSRLISGHLLIHEELEAELRSFVLARLQPYKHPRRVLRLDSFPRTHLGKIDRTELKRLGEAAR